MPMRWRSPSPAANDETPLPAIVAHHYRSVVLEALVGHGVHPAPTTCPALVHEFLNDLYRYELRRLRDSQIRGEIPKHDYATRVVELRRKYMLVSVPLHHWTTQAPV